MKLDDLITTVENSSPDDWHKMDIHTVSVPSVEEPKTFSRLVVYKPDVDISFVIGAEVVKPFDELWVQNFPNHKAESQLVWLRYRGCPVFEWTFVAVDGYRYLLPMPDIDEKGKYIVESKMLPLARLLFHLYGVGGSSQTVDEALKRADITIV